MTRLVRFSNNAVSQLAANLTISGTSLSVTPGDGAKFPSLTAGQYFMATLVKVDGSTEVVKVTARSTDTFTVVRAAEPVGGASTSYSFSAGDRIEARLTAGVLGDEIDRLDNGAVVEAINKSANYTLVADDVTKLVRVSTASGTTTITLPATSALADDYDVIVAKVTSDANTVVIARTGSTDLINGASSYTIYNQWQSAWLIADRSTNTWTVISSGMSAVNTVVDAGTGSGSATITLSGDPGSKNNTALFIGGVYQQKSTYSISGTTLTAGGTIASGVGYEVVWSAPLAIGTPSDGTITTAKLADGALAATVAGLAKMADGFLQATTAGLAKMADGFLAATTAGRAKMADGFVTPVKLSSDAQFMGFKNRIINGAMMIDQRNAGASVTLASGVSYIVDRFAFYGTQASKFSSQRNAGAVTPPVGFTNYLGFTSLAATTPAAGDVFQAFQNIEGLNVADLGWGTANAQAVTLTFWVRSSITGTHSGVVQNSGQNRTYGFTCTISAANTWEQKTVTIPGDTSGTWLTDNGVGLRVEFNLGTGSTYQGAGSSWSSSNFFAVTGSVNVSATNGATFYITGVQLEKGSTATSFDYRPYGTELSLCQRYYWQQTYDGTNASVCSSAYWSTSTNVEWLVAYPQFMRSIPSISIPTISGLYALESQVAWRQFSSYGVNEVGQQFAKISGSAATNTTYTKGQAAVVGLRSAGTITYSSEL